MSDAVTDRESLLRRIRGLQQKTVDNGCTEQEALAAAGLAANLIDRYGFSQSDLELRKEPVTEDSYIGQRKKLGGVIWVVGAVAVYCDCKVWSTDFYVPGQAFPTSMVKFFGRESDCAMAMYLTHLFESAMRTAWDEFKGDRRRDLRRRQVLKSFEAGMAARLSQRLREMKAERNTHVDATTGRTGTSLVVVKNAVVDEAFEVRRRELNLRKTKIGHGKLVDGSAFAAGHIAGDEVAINPGVTSTNAPKRIN